MFSLPNDSAHSLLLVTQDHRENGTMSIAVSCIAVLSLQNMSGPWEVLGIFTVGSDKVVSKLVGVESFIILAYPLESLVRSKRVVLFIPYGTFPQYHFWIRLKDSVVQFCPSERSHTTAGDSGNRDCVFV